MARIKLVLNERRLALIQAQEQAREPLPEGQEAEPDSNLWEDVPPEQLLDEAAAGGGQASTVKAQLS